MNSTEYVNSLFNLSGRTGIITGASRGIGMGIAKVLTDAGAKVYNLDIALRSDEETISGEMVDIRIDLTDEEQLKTTVSDIAAKEGHIDFLINDAGITYKCRAEEFPEEKLQKIEKLNLEIPFKLSTYCYPYLKKAEHTGRIINIASMAAYMGFTGVVPYCMTKSGIRGLTRGPAEEWKQDNIMVNSISPGWVLTKLNEKMFAENPDRKDSAFRKIMLGKYVDPKEIGTMALFLLSDACMNCSGQDFPVDGGALSHGF